MSLDGWRGMEASLRAVKDRGRGIARTLVSACIQCARNDSAKVIGLFTNELMTAAQQLYESMGFCGESEIPSRFGLRYWRYKLQLEEPITPEATWLRD